MTGPAWSTDSQVPEERGQYPLAVEAAIAGHARVLVPFTTTVTAHPRYYALHARVAAAAETSGADRSTYNELLRRAEVLLAAASILHAQENPNQHDPAGNLSNPHGFRAIAPELDGTELDLAGLAGRYGGGSAGYSGAYRGVEQAFGLAGGPAHARAPLPATALAALDAFVALAARKTVPIDELRDPALCLCAIRSSADGQGLRDAFFDDADTDVPADIRAARRAGRMSALLCVTAFDGATTDDRTNNLMAAQCCYGNVRGRLPSPDPACAAAAARWRGALLRNESVTAWRWLWWWITDTLDGAPSTVQVLTNTFTEAVIGYAGRDRRVETDLFGALPAGTNTDGTLLAAEQELRAAPGNAYWTEPLLWLRMLALGTRRLDELDVPAHKYFTAGLADWNPIETRTYLDQFADRRLSELAADLVPRLIRRAQGVARRRQQWTRLGLRMPTRLRPVGDMLYVTGPEGRGQAALRQYRMVQMLGALDVLGVVDGKWTPGPRAREVA